ncbi:MAG TPA: vitamin K epoxide reductase family protein [Chroococcales cyanobacterium]
MSTLVENQQQYQIKGLKELIGPRSSDLESLVADHQYKFLWTNMANVILAILLAASPFVFDYHSQTLRVSDIASGSLIVLTELGSFSPQRAWLRWATPVVALWLLFAPLVFWSPTPAVYILDTLVATLVIAFSILIPGMPGRGGIEMTGPDQPPGWTYNPSSWIRRWLGIALALMGFVISRYLAAHQLGYAQHAWDPFFGSSSDRVLHSSVSRAFPISDAGFGGVAYMLELISGFMGDRARWRSAPWVVVGFGLLVLPLGLTSICLVILQPVVVGAWCGLCLIAAAGLLASAPLAVHEVIAMGQFLVEAKRQKKDLWQIFWFGGSIAGAGNNDPDRRHFNILQRYIASVQGVTVPWTSLVQLAIGIWLMARPDIVATGTVASANCDHLLGAMIVTVAAMATAEVTRTLRFLNIPLGLALLVVAPLYALHTPPVMLSQLLSGALLIAVSIPKDRIIERYAGWDKFIK